MDLGEGDIPSGVTLCGNEFHSLSDQLGRLEEGQQSMALEVGRRQEIQIQLLEMLVDRIGSSTSATAVEDHRRWQLRVEELEQERDELLRQLAVRESSTEESSATGESSPEEAEDLRRRLELALDDLRESRAKIERLESMKQSSGGLSESLDWETQKRNLLHQLDKGELPATDRITMQQVIDATDDIVRRKDEEIDQLERLLQHQSENIQGFAVGAAAVAGLLETDELICQERENLERLQSEWREKLKRAEIEISMERARIARERKELETQTEDLQREKARLESLLAEKPEPSSRCRAEAAPKNRWFSRLGLSEKDDRS